MADSSKKTAQTLKPGESVQVGAPPSAEERAAKGGGVAQIPTNPNTGSVTPGEARGTVGDPTAKQAPEASHEKAEAMGDVPQQYKAMGPSYHTAVGLARAQGGRNWQALLEAILAILSAFGKISGGGIADPVQPPQTVTK